MLTTAVPFEILVSTMFRDNLDFLEAMFPHADYRNYHILVINQTDDERQLVSDSSRLRVINTAERGLPQSRNMAIKNAVGQVCLVADDDVRYVQEVEDIVVPAFAKAESQKENPTVITFQMTKGDGSLYQNYPNIRYHTRKSLYTVNGVVIAFDLAKLREQQILYNNHFGLGATFGTANEYVFMKNVLKAGAKALFEPKVILSHPAVSSGRLQGEDRVMYGRAALKYKEYGVFAYLWVFKYARFLLAQGYINWSEVSAKIRLGFKGIKKYRSLLKQGLETR